MMLACGIGLVTVSGHFDCKCKPRQSDRNPPSRRRIWPSLYQIDAFTDRPFAGNPAAVVPLDSWIDVARMQAIASENNLSETFLVPSSAPDSDFDIRWFTPTDEAQPGGDLGLGFVLFAERGWQTDVIRFFIGKRMLAASAPG